MWGDMGETQRRYRGDIGEQRRVPLANLGVADARGVAWLGLGSRSGLGLGLGFGSGFGFGSGLYARGAAMLEERAALEHARVPQLLHAVPGQGYG